MLRTIRGGLNSFFVLALLGLLIASFAVWGIGDVFRTVSANSVAKVGDTEITANDFNREYQQELQRLQSQIGQPIDRDQALQFGIPQRVLQRMIQRAMFDENVNDLGLRTSDDLVAKEVLATDAFSGLNGKFDKNVYTLTLDRLGMNPQDFEDSIRSDITRGHLFDTLTAAEAAPQTLATALYRFRNETRRATLVTVPSSVYELEEGPEEEELRQLYEASLSRYSTPEYRGLKLLVLRPADFADVAGVTEEEIQEEYDFRLEEFQTPDTRSFTQISFLPDEEALARRFAERVSAGEDFVAVATELTDFTADELDMGEVAEDEVANDYSARIAEVLYTSDIGTVTEPMESPFGWHVFRIDGEEPGLNRPLSEVAADLRTDVAERKAEGALSDASIEVEDMLLSGASLDEISQTLELPLVVVQKVSRAGLDPDGNVVETTPALAPYLGPAFQLDVADEPRLETLGEQGYYVAQVTQVFAPEPKPFEAVRNDLAEQWEVSELRRVAGEAVEQVVDRLERGATPEWAADQVGGVVIETGPIKRQASAQGPVSQTITDLIFDLPEGGISYEAAGSGDGYVAVIVESITPGNPADAPAERAQLAEQLREQMAADLLDQYFQSLRDSYEVTTNEPLLRQILGLDPAQPAS